jgi:hypothetical protein
LGPVLFSLYVAPIASVITSFGVSFHQYADDTQLYLGISPGSIAITTDLIDRSTVALRDWFTNNGMCLNPSKSEVLLVGTRQQLEKVNSAAGTSNFKVAGSEIIPETKIKSLGVVFDSELSFDDHVSAVCKAAHFHIRALRHIRRTISTDMAKTVACAIVGSRLDYCNALLFNISVKNINRLQRVQNVAARVVMNRSKFTHAKPILKELHWLPVNERIQHKLATLVYKTRFYHEPSYLANFLVDYVPQRSLRSSSKGLLVIPRTKTVTGSRAFSVAAPALWNCLPESLRLSDSVASFKAALKTYFFIKAFG